jgi:two-component system, sporulation sensor kinase E
MFSILTFSSLPLSPPHPADRSPLSRIVHALSVTLIYLGAYLALDRAAAALELAHGVSIWYPPPGLTLAILLICGVRYAPMVAIAEGLLGVLRWSDYMGPVALTLTALLTALGYALAAVLLTYSFRIDPRLLRVRDIFYFVLVALVSPLLVALANQSVLAATGLLPWSGALHGLSDRWSGEAIGILTVAPFLLVHGFPWVRTLVTRAKNVWRSHETPSRWRVRICWPCLLEGVAWLLAIAVILWVTLCSPLVREFRLFYLSFLLLILFALRHGMRGTTCGVLTLTLGSVLLVRLLHLTFISFAEMQVFMLTLALTGLVLGAIISERVLSEEAVREHEERLRTLINAMPDFVIFKDGQGRWLESNRIGLELFAIDPATYAGHTDRELAQQTPRLKEALSHNMHAEEQAWHANTPVRHEELFRQADGTVLTFEVIRVPLQDSANTRKGLVVIGRDITERKRAEEALATERAYLSSAVEILPVPLAFASATGEWTQTNPASHLFFNGLALAQWDTVEFLTPESHTPVPREGWPMRRAIHGEVLTGVELLMRFPDGRQKPVLLHAAPIYVGGKLVAAVVAFQDLTALKEADRAKDEFLGILSQELLLPLNDILGWAQAGLDSPQMTRQALEIITHTTRRQHRLLIDLLDLSRISHGRLTPALRRTDLRQIVSKSTDEFQTIARERRRQLKVELADERISVQADSVRLEQVIATLISRALMATDPGDTITISGYEDGGNAVVVIQDTGRGLTPEQQVSIFNPFQQTDSDADRGLGVELALAKSLVELHGGQLAAFSRGPGLGTIFTLELPLEDSAVMSLE